MPLMVGQLTLSANLQSHWCEYVVVVVTPKPIFYRKLASSGSSGTAVLTLVMNNVREWEQALLLLQDLSGQRVPFLRAPLQGSQENQDAPHR
jgi:hypothetical protein